MRIQLKQNEIEEAIKGFLTRQGIAVGGKEVHMLFTSGRKNNGLSVEVMIEEAVLTGNNPDSVILNVQDGQLIGNDDLSPPADPEEAYSGTPADEKEAEEGKVQGVVPIATAGSLFG